jgi:hypothetical protein
LRCVAVRFGLLLLESQPGSRLVGRISQSASKAISHRRVSLSLSIPSHPIIPATLRASFLLFSHSSSAVSARSSRFTSLVASPFLPLLSLVSRSALSYFCQQQIRPASLSAHTLA